MLHRERAYESVLRAGRFLLRDGWGHARLERALAGRTAALPHLRDWCERARGDSPLAIVHAPSAGEALMAQAIIAAARAARPDLQVVFTFFSPSAERIAPRTGADAWAYLPWDVSADAEALLTLLRPAVLAFVRTEIWPVLGHAAAARGVPSLLLNAVLSPGSSRLSRPARMLLGPAYRRLHAVGAVAREDGARFGSFGIDPDRVHVTGDARFDQVWARIQSLDPAAPLLARLRTGRRTLVAGSTWPVDERALAAALAALEAGERPRLILAPHEPTEAHLAGAARTLAAAGLTSRRLAEVEADGGSADVVLVDRVGVLADLYTLADVAYVGGGFGTAGLHSVVEPAALGVPVLYGPRHGNAREAGDLERCGGGRVVLDSTLTHELQSLLTDASARARAAAAAAAFVKSRLGGARANAALLLAALDVPRSTSV